MFATRMHYHISSSAYACFFGGMLNFQFRMCLTRSNPSVFADRSSTSSPSLSPPLSFSPSLSHSLCPSLWTSLASSLPSSLSLTLMLTRSRPLSCALISFFPLLLAISAPLHLSPSLHSSLSCLPLPLSLLCLLCLTSSLALPSSLFPPSFSPPFEFVLILLT